MTVTTLTDTYKGFKQILRINICIVTTEKCLVLGSLWSLKGDNNDNTSAVRLGGD